MPQLLFKRQFFEAIRQGRKTTTLRRWKRAHVAAGARALAPGLGWLRITACDRVELAQLQPADASADGFSSLAELRRTLRRLYPEQKPDGRQWYRVRFEMDAEQRSPAYTCGACRGGERKTRRQLVRRILAELDKAVAASRSWLGL